MAATTRLLGELVADLEQRSDAASDTAALRAQGIRSLAYRSDEVEPQAMFFCVPGACADGHDFAADAAARGAAVLAVERPVPVDVPQLRFENSRLALALISRAFYKDPSASLEVVAITGTNGKTTTTFLLDWIIRHALISRATPSPTGLIGTVETRVGDERLPSLTTTPESLDLQRLFARMREQGIRYVSMEVSSHAIALHRVAGVSFAAAAFTNLTQDHLDFHGSMEEYFETKAALFASPLVARRVIDIDTDFGRRLARRCEEAGQAAVTCGFSEDAQLRACDVSYGADCSTFTLRTPETSLRLSYPLIGAFNASNVLVATGLALALGFSLDEVAAALVEAPQVPGRLERVRARAIAAAAADQPPIGVFVDYAHTPDSIAKAIDALRVTKAARVIIVFGCGGDRDRTKRPLMGKAALAADYAIVTSDNPRGEDPLAIIADILPGMDGATDRYEVICERREAIARALSIARPGDLVLIAGKGHEDYQLVEGRRLPFDDRLVASEEMRALVDAGHWQKREKGGPSCA